jgi:hypothetical protein
MCVGLCERSCVAPNLRTAKHVFKAQRLRIKLPYFTSGKNYQKYGNVDGCSGAVPGDAKKAKQSHLC